MERFSKILFYYFEKIDGNDSVLERSEENLILADTYFNQVKFLLQDKDLDIPKLERARGLLQKCRDLGYQKSYWLEQMLGRIDLLEARILQQKDEKCDVEKYITSAKSHFYAALTTSKMSLSPKLGLFKAAVLGENYEEAYKELEAYDISSSYNFSLMYALLDALMGKDISYEPVESKYILNGRVSFPPIIKNYYLAGRALKDKAFDRVVKHLEICHHLALQKEPNIDFSYVLLLARKLLEKWKEEQKADLKTYYAKDKHIGNRMLISQKMLEIDKDDVECHFYFMDSYINLKVFSPLIEECQFLRTRPLTDEQEEMVSLYERLIHEKQLEGISNRELAGLLDNASKLERSGGLAAALAYYRYGYRKMKIPFLQLKMADLAKALGDSSTAIACAESYLQEGYFYYEQASQFLYQLYRNVGDLEKAKEVAIDCHRKTRMQEKGISLDEWMQTLEQQYDSDLSGGGVSSYPSQMVYQKN